MSRKKWKNEFSEWFNDIIVRAEIMDVRYPIKGLYVWFPYGFQVRKGVLELLRRFLEDSGHEEGLFPLLIPDHEFAKEAKHVKGFEDEVYWVTHGGLKPLKVKLALRPTSETSIYPMYSVWIRSHADMPLKIYQIVNTFRYETKHTRPLLRLREITTFKEAHTVHASYEDAEKNVEEAIGIYKKFFDSLGVPYVVSRRPDWDKFPGAEYTMAFDTIFPDGRTLQIGTIHNLGQNFSKTFDIQFENTKGEQEYAYQTCYGISDRAIASLLAIHGDDRGLCLMPDMAPIQCVIVPIWYKDKEDKINEAVKSLVKKLTGLRVDVDDRDIRPGNKFFDWEIKGVPLRIEIGPKDLEKKQVTVVRRDTLKKDGLPLKDIKKRIIMVLQSISKDMKERAWEEFRGNIHDVTSLKDAEEIITKEGGIVRAKWCGIEECGKGIEEEITGNIVGITEENARGKCIRCKNNGESIILLAKTY